MIALLVGLAMQIILEAQKPDISLERKTQAVQFAVQVLKYANEHPEKPQTPQFGGYTADEMRKIDLARAQEAASTTKVKMDAINAKVKADKIKELKTQLAEVDRRIIDNQEASAKNQSEIVRLGTGITSYEMSQINTTDAKLRSEYEILRTQRDRLYLELRQVE